MAECSEHRNFYLPPPWPGPGAEAVLSEKESRHAMRAARIVTGEKVRLVDGEGREAAAEVLDTKGHLLRVRLLEVHDLEVADPYPRSLALPRLHSPARMDWVVEKATELGCRSVRVYEAERSLKGARAACEARAERWRALACAAMKQSGRAWCPTIRCDGSLAELLAEREGAGRVLYGDVAGCAAAAIKPLCRGVEILMVVGPEGGLSEIERSALRECGAQALCLGTRRLRSETAAVALAAVVAAATGGA